MLLPGGRCADFPPLRRGGPLGHMLRTVLGGGTSCPGGQGWRLVGSRLGGLFSDHGHLELSLHTAKSRVLFLTVNDEVGPEACPQVMG